MVSKRTPQELVAGLKAAPSAAERLAALREIKNAAIGCKRRKAAFVAAGALPLLCEALKRTVADAVAGEGHASLDSILIEGAAAVGALAPAADAAAVEAAAAAADRPVLNAAAALVLALNAAREERALEAVLCSLRRVCAGVRSAVKGMATSQDWRSRMTELCGHPSAPVFTAAAALVAAAAAAGPRSQTAALASPELAAHLAARLLAPQRAVQEAAALALAGLADDGTTPAGRELLLPALLRAGVESGGGGGALPPALAALLALAAAAGPALAPAAGVRAAAGMLLALAARHAPPGAMHARDATALTLAAVRAAMAMLPLAVAEAECARAPGERARAVAAAAAAAAAAAWRCV